MHAAPLSDRDDCWTLALTIDNESLSATKYPPSLSLPGAFAPSMGTLGTHHTAHPHRPQEYHKAKGPSHCRVSDDGYGHGFIPRRPNWKTVHGAGLVWNTVASGGLISSNAYATFPSRGIVGTRRATGGPWDASPAAKLGFRTQTPRVISSLPQAPGRRAARGGQRVVPAPFGGGITSSGAASLPDERACHEVL